MDPGGTPQDCAQQMPAGYVLDTGTGRCVEHASRDCHSWANDDWYGQSGCDTYQSDPNIPSTKRAPCNKNWMAGKGIKALNQGKCGSCWLFGAAEQLRLSSMIQTGYDPGQLSTEYFVDCYPQRGLKEYDGKEYNLAPLGIPPSCTQGNCCGGSAYEAMRFISTGGIPTAAAYGDRLNGMPDSALWPNNVPKDPSPSNSQCKMDTPKVPLSIKSLSPHGLAGVPKLTEAEMADHVCNKGPLIATIHGAPLQSMQPGRVMHADQCMHDCAEGSCRLDHTVQIVGGIS